MKPLLFVGLILSLASCSEVRVKESANTSNEKSEVSTHDLENVHILSVSSTTAARKINISASEKPGVLCLN